MSKHSPGPWLDISDGANKYDKRRMALVATAEGTVAIDCTGSGKSFRQDCANARLIAAAPELLEALTGLDRSLLNDRALAAIAKATGEANEA